MTDPIQLIIDLLVFHEVSYINLIDKDGVIYEWPEGGYRKQLEAPPEPVDYRKTYAPLVDLIDLDGPPQVIKLARPLGLTDQEYRHYRNGARNYAAYKYGTDRISIRFNKADDVAVVTFLGTAA